MPNLKQTPSTEIQVNGSRDDLLRILKEQYAHMEQGEARAALERMHKPVWTNDELLENFEVSHFDPPVVHVIRKTDGRRGTVAFIDQPRLYFAFHPEDKDDARTPSV